MRKNDPYKIIKQLLEQVHLKPGKKDWEQMQVMLNKELPLPKTTKWFKPAHYFFAGSVVAVITASVFILKHEHALTAHINKDSITVKKEKSNDTALNKNAVLNNKTTTEQNSEPGKDTANKNEGLKNSSIKNDSVGSALMQAENNKISTEKNKQSTAIRKNDVADYNQHGISNKKNNVEYDEQHSITDKKINVIADNNQSALNEKNNASRQEETSIENSTTKQYDNSIKKDNNVVNNSSVFTQNKSEINRLNNKPTVTDSSLMQNKSKILTADSLQSIAKINGKVNQSHTKKQSNNNNKGKPKNAGMFQYGFQLSPLQYFTDADKKISGSYVPGVFGEYLFTKNIGVHVGISPFNSSNINNTQIFTDSTSNNDTVLTSTYYLSHLRVMNGEFSLVYKHNHLSVEAGAGIQTVLSGKGEILSTHLFDTSGLGKTSSKVFYHNSDVAFKTVNKSMLNYHLNVLYNFNRWQIGVGYYQNSKGWIKNNSGKIAGSTQLQIRYRLSPGKK